MRIRNVYLNSCAKINLFLDVLSKRIDGYHNIRTIFQEIALSDRLNFILTKNEDIKILSNKHFVNVEDNLIYKVAIFIKEEYNVLDGVTVELEKNIPISAGLGGGSSNAATTIKGLSQLWNLKLSLNEMHKIAAKFGSDINFFLEGGTALGEGRGEIISAVEDIDLENIFLVKPDFGISSAEAYKAVNQNKLENHSWKYLLKNGDMSQSYNKLEEGIIKIYSEIGSIIEKMKKVGTVNSILSGSGSTVIGFCPNRKIAEELSEFYSKKGYWNCITKSKKRSTL